MLELEEKEQEIVLRARDIIRKAREFFGDSDKLHNFFSQTVSDKTLLSIVNSLLREEEPILRDLTYFEIAEIGLAYRDVLKCQICEPQTCDGLKPRFYKRKDGTIGVEYVFCKERYRYMLIEQVEETLMEDTIMRALDKFGVSSLDKLNIPQLLALLEGGK